MKRLGASEPWERTGNTGTKPKIRKHSEQPRTNWYVDLDEFKQMKGI